jgi:hypothetical protein
MIKKQGLKIEDVEAAVAREFSKFPSVALALPSSSLLQGQVANTVLNQKVLNNHNPGRSGNIYIVFKSHRFINDFGGTTVASSHGSPWSYDSYVPIIFAGNGLKAKRVSRPVNTVDVATTLSSWLGIKPPSGASGLLLDEVVSQKRK